MRLGVIKMLVMTSNGFSSQKLHDEMKKYMNENHKSAAVIMTATVGYKERLGYIPQFTSELELLGLEVCYFDIEYDPIIELLKYDVIAVNGGNPFYLLKQMKAKECQHVFEKLVADKIVIGRSAGSIVFQESIDLVAQYSPEMNEGIGLSDFKGMCLTSEEILPHYDTCINTYEGFEERAKEYEQARNKKVIRLNDGEALIMVNGHSYVV